MWVPGPGSRFLRRLLPSALDEAGPRLPAHTHPRPLPMLFGASSQHPCLHYRTPRQRFTWTLPSIRCEPQRSHVPFVASVSLKLSGPSQSPRSLVTIPGPWRGWVMQESAAHPVGDTAWMMSPGPEWALRAGRAPRPFLAPGVLRADSSLWSPYPRPLPGSHLLPSTAIIQ